MMSVGLFATILLILLLILAWGQSRVILAAVVALMLGITLASSGGALADTSRTAVEGVRMGLSSLGSVLDRARGIGT
jgi:hypothetical protein